MFGAIIGDVIGFPYEYKHEDRTDTNIPLCRTNAAGTDPSSGNGEGQAGEDFSDKTVMTAAVEAGILQFERLLPTIMAGKAGQDGGEKTSGQAGAVNVSVGGKNVNGPNIPQNAFEENFKKELTAAMRRLGQAYPLAGYTMDLSVWLFRGGSPVVKDDDAGPAARVSPVAWTFQDDLYMMRHVARLQAELTNRSKEAVKAAEAAACAVFLAIHGSTKPYIAGYLEREFGYKIPDEEAMKEEILRAGGARMISGFAGMTDSADTGAAGSADGDSSCLSALCVRAAMTAFLNGRDFEDVVRRAVSLGGNSADITAIAGAAAEAFFGIPEDIKAEGLRRLPEDLRKAAEAFAAREAQKKAARDQNPAARERWENAMTRATARHPAAVQGNEPIEQAIDVMLAQKDEKSLIAAMEVLRRRMNQKGRVFVPLISVKRSENTQAAGRGDASDQAPQNGLVYSMQAIRTKDGKLWQPAYTSRAQLDKANAALAKARAAAGAAAGPDNSSGMVLSYAMDALFMRFLPAGSELAREAAGADRNAESPDGQNPPVSRESIPDEIQGIVLNPFDKIFFIPRKTIESIFLINREASRANRR